MCNTIKISIKNLLFPLTAFVLAAAIILAGKCAFAGEAEPVSAEWINPAYSDFTAENDDGTLKVSQSTQPVLGLAQTPDFDTSAAATRELMAARTGSVSVNFRIASSDEMYSWSYQNIFYEYLSRVYAYNAEDGRLGDYLHYNVYSVSSNGSKLDDSSYKYYTLTFTCIYNSDAAMEAWVDEQIPLIAGQLEGTLTAAGKQDNQADIFLAVYNYITANVAYDYDSCTGDAYRAQATAYNGLHDGKCVCQGFALIFYRLATEMGLNARFISSRTQNHGWNIVRIGAKWYELDVTWDSGRAVSAYDYCLLGTTNWLGTHKVSGCSTAGDQFNDAEFAEAHPLYTEDFELWTVENPDYNAVNTAAMSISNTLSVNMEFAEELPESRAWNIEASFNGTTCTSKVSEGGSPGTVCFTGITAQCMSDEMTVSVKAVNGDEVLYSFDSFSFTVRDYCDMLYESLKDSPGNEKTLKLIADLLEYGAACQSYAAYRTEDLANNLSWVPAYKSATAAKPDGNSSSVTVGTASKINAISLKLGNDLRFCVYISSENEEDVLNISDGDSNDEAYTMTDGTAIAGGYKIESVGLNALDYSKTFTFTLNGGEDTASYSVNSYISSKWDSADTKLASLVKALYNYGCSAQAAAA